MTNNYALKALSFLGVSSVAGAGLAFLTQVILARNLGVSDYGTFSSALAVVALMTPLAGFGIAPMWLRIFGLEGHMGMRWIKPSLIFSAISTALAISLVIVWAFWVAHDVLTRTLLAIMSTYVIGQAVSELVAGKLQLEERYFKLAVWQFLPHVGRFSLIISVVYLCRPEIPVAYIAFSYATISIILVAFGVRSLIGMTAGGVHLSRQQDYYRSSLEDAYIGVGKIFKTSWPFGVGAFAHLVYYQSDIIMVKYFVGDKAAGEYNVAFVVISAVYLLPSILYQKYLMPKIHRWSNYDLEKFYSLYKVGGRMMLLFGVCAMLSLWLLGGWAIEFLFGKSYLESAQLLEILAVSVPIIFLALNSGSVLVTQEHMIQKVKYMIFVAIVNFSLNLVCIPLWGAVGAAMTTVVSNIVLLALYQYGASTKVFALKKG